jgi:hypothetical protein
MDDDDEEELYPEIEELKPEFLRLMRESAEIKGSDMGAAERRAAAEGVFKEQLRRACLTHSTATEADFERLWPRLRDDAICDHTMTVYFQVIAALAEEFGDDFDDDEE